MTPLPRDIGRDLTDLTGITEMWVGAFVHAEEPPEFVFAVGDDAQDRAMWLLRKLAAHHEVDTIPVPHDALTKLFPEVKADWERARFGEIALYRNLLLDEARRRKPDMAVFLDSDVVPGSNMLALFREDGRDACGGVVKTFNNDWEEVYGFGTFRTPFFTGLDWAPKVPEGPLTRVDFANTACLALSWRVLDDERARFEPLTLDYQGVRFTMSEDHSFCKLLSDLGYGVYVDSRVRCDHFRMTPKGARWLRATQEWTRCAGRDGCGYEGPTREFTEGRPPQHQYKCPRCGKGHTFECLGRR